LVLTIEGHVDEADSPDRNLALGLRRAMAVSDRLLELGVSPEKVRIVTYGSSHPIDGSASDEKLKRAVLLVTGYKFDD
jgi:peptidoglycan-associated lipoprotein